MRPLLRIGWILAFLLVASCFITVYGRRGGGGRGGGSRGSSSRGSSGRGSTSNSGSRGTTYDRDRYRSRNPPAPPAPPPRQPDPPKVPKATIRPYVPSPRPQAPKPSAPEVRQPASNPNFKETGPQQPAYNPNFKETSANNPNVRAQNPQQPPPYSPRQNPPGYSPPGQPPPAGAPPPYSPAGQAPPYSPGGAPPPYSPQGQPYNPSMGVPNANYPRQPGAAGIPNANYPRQPGMQDVRSPQQSGAPMGNYPSAPGGNYPRPPGYPSGNYPQQGGIPGANYPRQPGGIGGASYPRQQPSYPAQTLGGHVWQPQSGRPAPAYMNYGGLPTGANMYQKPYKKKGLLGSLMSMGGSSKIGKQPKYYGSYPSPYGGFGGGMGKYGKYGGHGGFNAKTAAMYTILPYMAYRGASSAFRPRFGFMPIFLPSPFHHHHYYGHSHGYYGHTHYNVYNDDYIGRCNRPIKPHNANITCNATRKEVECEATCHEGYFFPDKTTRKDNRCWHVTGVWRPNKNFEECKPVCNVTCLNGGSCSSPNVCGCPPEYRGEHCEYHFLKCDVRKLAGDVKIRWVCTHTKNETKCRIQCRDQKEFETPPAEEYRCTPDGTWSSTDVPKCVEPSLIPKNETITTTTITP